MPTPELLQASGSFLSLGHRLELLPFKWFPKRNLLIKSSRLHQRIWKLFVFIMTLKFLHFGTVCVNGLNGERSATKRSYDGLSFLSTFFGVLSQVILWNKLDDIPDCYNSMHEFLRRIRKFVVYHVNLHQIPCLNVVPLPFN